MPPAFPSAEGFGNNSEGGRGGVVFLVDLDIADNVGSPAAGSVREAFEATGKRYVMFKQGGIYNLAGDLTVTDRNITIAGESCPSDSGGVLFRDYELRFQTDNVICRYIRVRVGVDKDLDTNANPILIGGGGSYAFDCIFDHCEGTLGGDQNGPEVTGKWSDVTIQWCASGESSDPTHAFGPLIDMVPWNSTGTIGTISYHHNWIHNVSNRTPKASSGLSQGSFYANPAILADIRNVFIHNSPNNHVQLSTRVFNQGAVDTWEANTSTPRHAVRANVVGCVLSPGGGPGSQTSDPGKEMINVNDQCQVYAEDNRQWSNQPGNGPSYDGLSKTCRIARYTGNTGVDGTEDGQNNTGTWDPVAEGVEVFSPFTVPSIVTTVSEDLEAVIMANCGAILPTPSSILMRWRSEVANNTGTWSIVATDFPTLAAGTPPLRSQPDQIEDEFKDLFGFSNSVDYTGQLDPSGSGYDVIELYLHWRAGEVSPSIPPEVFNVYPVGQQLNFGVETLVAGFNVVNSPTLSKVRFRVSDGATITTIDDSGGGNVG